MAYRAKHIEEFIEKVKAEAEKAAQDIFDKHNAKLQEMVSNQVLDGHRLYIGMGTATVKAKRELPYDYAEKFLSLMTDSQYHKDTIVAGFHISDVDKGFIKDIPLRAVGK